MHQKTDFTRFYDWDYKDFTSDIPLYLELAKQYGSPILEIACGTGRVMLPLARAGFEIVGLDISEPMLHRARTKWESEPKKVRDRMSFIHDDMRNFQLDRNFSAVFVPNASLFNLLNPEDLAQCIACLYNHTKPGGIAVADLWAPHRMANQEIGNLRLYMEGINPLTGLKTKYFNQKLKIDQNRQIVRVQHIYTEQEGSEEKRYESIWEYRWIEEQEGVDLFFSADFVDVTTYGDYDLSAFSENSERLIIMGKRSIEECC
jgi:SAM-dependent methyltransferase